MSFGVKRAIVAGASACALLAAARPALAVNCSSLPGKIIYGAGGSSQQPFLSAAGNQLAQLSSPISIVYSDTGSACVGYLDLVTPTAITGTALYWDGSGAAQTCDLDIAGDPVTFAVMGNAADLCSGVPDGGTNAAKWGTFLGPVQPVDFVVPAQSNQQSISTAAAYYIFGFGAKGPNTVSPWSTPADIFVRSSSSFATLFVALDTGVPAATIAANGTSESTSTDTVTALAALNGTSGANAGVGFVSGEVADGNRASIKALAYQHTGQSCGYWPDSTSTAFDKVNVRDGQYWLWSPIHFFAAVDSSGNITDPDTAALIGYLTGTVAGPTGFDFFQAELTAYTVPQCAMHVWRDGDLAALYSKQPAASCSCEFDIATSNANKPTGCQTCTSDTGCTPVAPHCRNIGPPLNADGGANVGYCEVN